jgi:hypothetical protein
MTTLKIGPFVTVSAFSVAKDFLEAMNGDADKITQESLHDWCFTYFEITDPEFLRAVWNLVNEIE